MERTTFLDLKILNFTERVSHFKNLVKQLTNITKNIKNILKKCITLFINKVLDLNILDLISDKKFEALFDKDLNEFESFYFITQSYLRQAM